MDIDQAIVQLGERLDAWWDGFRPLLNSEDRTAQGTALLRGFEITKEFDRLKADGLATLATLVNVQHSVPADERAASLIRAFKFGARLADTLHDEFMDTADGETKIVNLTDEIVKSLNRIGSGRAALAVLLDDPDASVRALAGVYLIDLMPERVGPILHQVHQQASHLSAGLRAHMTLSAWERVGVARFNYLSG